MTSDGTTPQMPLELENFKFTLPEADENGNIRIPLYTPPQMSMAQIAYDEWCHAYMTQFVMSGQQHSVRPLLKWEALEPFEKAAWAATVARIQRATRIHIQEVIRSAEYPT